MINKVLIICPKWESIRFKSDEERVYLEEVIQKELDNVLSCVPEVYYLYEDTIAVKMLEEEPRAICISTLSEVDRKNFVTDYVSEDFDNYTSKKILEVGLDIRKEALKRYKPLRFVAGSMADYEFISKRSSLVNKRIKFSVEELCKDEQYKAIIYFDNGTNFAKCPVPTLGDGKLIVNVCASTIKNRMPQLNFGGMAVTEEVKEIILKGLK